MKILITSDVFPPRAGGSGHSTAALAAALERRGHQTTVVVPRAHPSGQTEWQGVPVREAVVGESRREKRYRDYLSETIDRQAFDLVHAQHWLSASASHGALPALPMVVTVRDYWPACIWSTMLSGAEPCPGCSYRRRVVCVGRRKPWLWPLTPLLPPLVGRKLAQRGSVLHASAAVVAVSCFVADRISSGPSEIDSKLQVIPNLLDLEKLASIREREPLENLPQRYLLFVGKLEPNKAPDQLFSILAEAKTELPLVVAGSGSLEGELRAEAGRRGCDLRFLGWTEQADTLRLLRHASAVLYPSRWQEPLSRVLLEALGVGAVLIVEPTGGSEDAVVDGCSALLGRGPKELGRALARVLADPDLADRLRAGALARAEATFGAPNIVPRIEAVYERVLS